MRTASSKAAMDLFVAVRPEVFASGGTSGHFTGRTSLWFDL
jgi:hypothetical protein